MIQNKEIGNIINVSRSLEMVSELLNAINSFCEGNCEITSYEDDNNKALVNNLICSRIPIYNQMSSNTAYTLMESMFYVSQEELEALKNGEYVVDNENKAFGNFLKKNIENNQYLFSKLQDFTNNKTIIGKSKEFRIYGLVQIKNIRFSNDLILANEISDKLKDASICLYKVTVIDDIYDRKNMVDITDSTCDKVRKIRHYANGNDFTYLDITIESNDNIAGMIKNNLMNYYPKSAEMDIEDIKKSNFQSAELISNAIVDLQTNSQEFFTPILEKLKDIKHDSVKIIAEMVDYKPTQSIKIYFNDIMLMDYIVNFSNTNVCGSVIDLFRRLDYFFNLTTSDLVSKNINKSDLVKIWGEW